MLWKMADELSQNIIVLQVLNKGERLFHADYLQSCPVLWGFYEINDGLKLNYLSPMLPLKGKDQVWQQWLKRQQKDALKRQSGAHPTD